MARRLLGVAVLGCLALALAARAVPAAAAGPTVYGYGSDPCVSGCYWNPASTPVQVGIQVTWMDANGSHGLDPQDSLGAAWPSACSSGPAPATCTFTKAGTYVFYCFYHGDKMKGSIVVSGAPAPPPSPSPIPSPTPRPTPTRAPARPSPTPAVPSPSPSVIALALASPTPTAQPVASPPPVVASARADNPAGAPVLPIALAGAALAAAGGAAFYWFRRGPAA